MPDRETILRSITLAAVLVNQLIAASGRTPLPYTEEEFYQGLSAVVTVVSACGAGGKIIRLLRRLFVRIMPGGSRWKLNLRVQRCDCTSHYLVI